MTSKRVILCFGDSLTEGWLAGGTRFLPYTQHLQRLCGDTAVRVVNSGVSGELVSEGMQQRLRQDINQHSRVDLLILQGGTNDILTNAEFKSRRSLFAEFKKLIEFVEHNVKEVCVLTCMEGYYTPVDGAVMSQSDSDSVRVSFNKQLLEYAAKSSNKYLTCCDVASQLPFYSLNSDEKMVFWDDMIHPSEKGYEKMAHIIYQHIKDKIQGKIWHPIELS